jgi:hypothetical protein
LNYTIPKDRQEAIEIFNRLNYNFILNSLTKYDMFIGALTECSDKEFKENTRYNEFGTIPCAICLYNELKLPCAGDCLDNVEIVFSKRWNE